MKRIIQTITESEHFGQIDYLAIYKMDMEPKYMIAFQQGNVRHTFWVNANIELEDQIFIDELVSFEFDRFVEGIRFFSGA